MSKCHHSLDEIRYGAECRACVELERDQLRASLAAVTAERDDWKCRYFNVADAIGAESTGVDDLIRQTRQIRKERDDLRVKARLRCEELERELEERKRAEVEAVAGRKVAEAKLEIAMTTLRDNSAFSESSLAALNAIAKVKP